MKNKETLFSKSNYDFQLEELLDKKDFDDEAKSLILNILYKIEEAYKDYAKVKFDTKLKWKIIEDLLNIINNKCDKIEILNLKDNKKKFLVNRKEKTIKVFPNEINLLEALYYINTNVSRKREDIFNKALRRILNKGMAINNTEIIRDFNGWSWNNVIDTKLNRYYNLIYQDLLLLIGNEALSNIIIYGNDIRLELSKKIEDIYGEKSANLVIDLLEKCCILIYIQTSINSKTEVFKYLEEKKQELIKITNKSEYISKITIENNENMKTVSKIENILKSEALLSKKYNQKSVQKKYNTIEDYKEALKKLKNKKLKKINNNSSSINPFEYVKRKKTIEHEVKSLNDIMVLARNKNSIYLTLITLQRKVISCLYKKIEVYDLKKELINLIYEVRYYNLLPVEQNYKIKDVKELEVDLRNMQKKLTSKLCENKVIDTFARDYNINYNIIKYIFITKMININKIQLSMNYENKKLNVSYYDENVLEKEEKINFNEDDFNELTKKTNKKMRIII